MNWIQKNYEKALLIFAGTLAILGAAWIILKATGFKSQLAIEETAQGKNLDPLSADAVKDAAQRVQNVPQWPANLNLPLFSSTPFVVMNDRPDEPFQMRAADAPKLRDPIDNVWLVDNDLDYTSVDVREQDPDRDGFSNLDEFLGQTDPNSSLSKPTFDTKLYFSERVEEPLSLRLSSYDSGTCSIAFITKDASGNELPRINDRIKVGESSQRFEPGRFKVVEVKTETVERFGSPSQVPVAFVVDAKDRKQERIRLEQGKIVDHPTYLAKFDYTLTSETHTVKEGEDITLSKPAGKTITVEEIHPDNVVLSFVPEGQNDLVKVTKKLMAPPK